MPTQNRTDEPKRGRETTRRDETQQRRRRRDDAHIGRLGVDMAMLDKVNFSYRWINDTAARMHMMTKADDWDIVHQDGGEVKEDSDLGSAISHVSGNKQDGSPMLSFLCRKPKHWYDEDQDKKKIHLEKQMDELRRGNDRDGVKQSDYVPSEGISL